MTRKEGMRVEGCRLIWRKGTREEMRVDKLGGGEGEGKSARNEYGRNRRVTENEDETEECENVGREDREKKERDRTDE